MLDEAIRIAQSARAKAYCPYSGYSVGACVAFRSGADKILKGGCNVENASYGLSICAERNAVFSAISSHCVPEIELVVVATKDGGTPCGACLQVIVEFAAPGCSVVCVDEHSNARHYELSELLPHAFTSKALEKES